MAVDDPQIARRHSRWILLSVCMGQTIVGLDQRALTVVLPTLTTTFHTPFTTIQWTVLVYDLVLIGLIITMGRLGDLFGRRRFYSAGFVIFLVASGLCGCIADRRPADFFPRRPSARRFDDRGQRPRHRLRESAARGTGPRSRSHLDGVSHRLSHRAFPRRLFDRQHRLALDFLSQLAVQLVRRLPRLESRAGNPDHGKSHHRRARRCAAAADQRTIHLRHRSIAAGRLAPSGISF